MNLNIGSGPYLKEGYVNMDIIKHKNVDISHDLSVFPWPVESDSVEHLYAMNIIEHLEDTTSVMREIFRILKPGSKCYINVPYYKSEGAFRDPTHVSFFTENTMDYFSINGRLSKYNYYNDVRFEIVEVIPRYSPKLKILKYLSTSFLFYLAHYISFVGDVSFILKKPKTNLQ
jgi:SAM-dependent methyltransferase